MTDDPRHAELASFGEELRREREIRGISVKEIADATKISRRFLEAIERNDHKTLPAPVFTRGFVREYARYLGLNADEIVNRYNFAAAGDDRIEKSDHLERLTTPQTPTPPAKKSIPRARIDRNIIIIALIVAALGALSWWAIRHKRAEAETQHAADSTAVAAPAPPPAATTSTTATSPTSTTAKSPTSTAAPADRDTLRLQVEASDNSWVVLEADGKTVINDEMRRGDRRTVEAKDRFRFRTIGNAGGVSLTLNDVKLPSLGAEGEVLHDRVFDRSTLQQLAAETRDRT
jgi:cytoskeletal protein RodZ